MIVSGFCLSMLVVMFAPKLAETPGHTSPDVLRNYRVYSAPDGQEYRLPLLVSLMEIRSDNWSIIFNEESDEFEEANENDLLMMINEVCSS